MENFRSSSAVFGRVGAPTPNSRSGVGTVVTLDARRQTKSPCHAKQASIISIEVGFIRRLYREAGTHEGFVRERTRGKFGIGKPKNSSEPVREEATIQNGTSDFRWRTQRQSMTSSLLNGARPLMRMLKMGNYPIFQQLLLEERLLRTSDDNWCLLNDGSSPPPAIVMGISGKPEKLLEVEKVVKDRVPVIRRFSGGGTVVVDEGTMFVTLICSRSALPGLELYPRQIMSWTELLYVPVFEKVQGFSLREHDYVFNDHKFGGNAQSIIKNRWLHHTSFLWDFHASRMAYLKLPERAPAYRRDRNHSDFICRLRDYLPSREFFMNAVEEGLERHFVVKEESLNDAVDELADRPHISRTQFLSLDELTAPATQPS